jgi:hypothetical protein
MAELTPEQQRALALAEARKRKAGVFTDASGATVVEQDGRPLIIETPNALDAERAIDAGKVPNGQIIDADPMRAGEAPPPVPYTPSQIPGLPPEVNQYAAPVVDRVNALGTTFAQNVPWLGSSLKEFGNNLDAGAASVMEGRPVTKEERAQITKSEQDKYPEMSVPGAFLGNTLPLAPFAATKAGQVAFGLAGPTLLRMGLGGGTGGLIASTDALTDGATPEEAMDAGIWGGGFGVAGGFAAPWVDDVLSSFGRRYLPKSSQPADNLSPAARNTLLRGFGSDDALGPNGMRTLQAGDGSTVMLVDASPSSVGTLDAAIARGGPGAKAARNAVEARATEANTTINTALDDTLGVPRGIKSTETELRDGTAAARETTYNRAYSRPIDYASGQGRRIETLVGRVPKDIVDAANRQMIVEGHASSQILAKVADDGTVTFFRQPDVRQIDYITRALNSAAHATVGEGKLGGMTDYGSALGNLGRQLRDVTRSAVPEYDVALRTAAHPIQQREALRFGGQLMSANMPRDEAREVIKGFTKPQMEMVRQGVRSHIDEVLANVKEIISNPNLEAQEALRALRDLSSRAARDKIRMVLDDDTAANRLFGEMAKAQKALELRANVAKNSQTYGRTDADLAIKEQIDSGAGGALLRGEPLNASKRVVQNLTGRTPAGERAMSDKVWAEIANTLTLRDNEAIDMLSSLMYRGSQPKPQSVLMPGAEQYSKDYGYPIVSR